MQVFPDPRAASTVVVGGEEPDLVGDEIGRLEIVDLDDQTIGVPALLPGAAEYGTVARAEVAADLLLRRIPQTLDNRGAITTAEITLAVDFRQTAGTGVASAAAGLEAFANYHVERCAPSPEVVREIENAALNDRYANHLPRLLDTPRPTNEPWWPTFRRIQGLAALQRHGVTGPRGRPGLEGILTLTQRLYNREYSGAAEMMLAAFEHFAPGWITEDRRILLAGEAEPNPP